MGRKSALTETQWLEIERRHLVEGESLNALSKEFKVNESSLRRRIKPKKTDSAKFGEKTQNPLQQLASDKVEAEERVLRVNAQIAELPAGKQAIVSDLARKMVSISQHLGSAAEISAATSHRLAILANIQLEKVDDVDPLKSLERLKAVALIQTMANSAAQIPNNLVKANREIGNPDHGVEDITDDELDAEIAQLQRG